MKLTEVENRLKETMKAKVSAIGSGDKTVLTKLDASILSLKLIKSELLKENQRVYERSEYQMTEEQETLFLNGMAETRKENVKKYSDNGRKDLAEAEQLELDILTDFLPKMPTEEEIKVFIGEKIDEHLAAQEADYKLSMRDMGKIKSLVNATYPTVTGNLIKDVVLSRING